MRAHALLPLVVAGIVLLVGCSGDPSARTAAAVSRASATPTLGGPPVVRTSPPAHAMNRMERPVAALLARRVARSGLTLQHLDCPSWAGRVPSRMRCRGYLDGLVTTIEVTLSAAVSGETVGFAARLTGGVIATGTLEATLRAKGWDRADCGDRAAYPARVGSRIVCQVSRRAHQRYVVATVRSRRGAVSLADYAGATGDP